MAAPDPVSLTSELLAERAAYLYAGMIGQVEGPILGAFASLCCDRCGQCVDLTREPFPEGWTTAGDLPGGWTDLCRGCSG